MTLPPPMSAAEVVELRQYTLRPGARADLVRLFESELIEPQEAAGMRVGGVFLDRDDPDRFVWFRGFADMESRRRGLEDFYYGPVWREHGAAANATMLDSDDVLLLRPTDPRRPASEPAGERPPVGAARPSTAEWVTVSVYVHPPDSGLTRWLTTEFHEAVQQELGVPVAAWRTEPAENSFPRLPVRAENAFVWSAVFPGEEEYAEARGSLGASKVWRGLAPRLDARDTRRQCLRLQPTGRSQHPAPVPLRS